MIDALLVYAALGLLAWRFFISSPGNDEQPILTAAMSAVWPLAIILIVAMAINDRNQS